jgi:hypothetical protein
MGIFSFLFAVKLPRSLGFNCLMNYSILIGLIDLEIDGNFFFVLDLFACKVIILIGEIMIW